MNDVGRKSNNRFFDNLELFSFAYQFSDDSLLLPIVFGVNRDDVYRNRNLFDLLLVKPIAAQPYATNLHALIFIFDNLFSDPGIIPDRI